MADYRISHPTKVIRGRLQLPGSKSETNRLLILRALYFPELDLEGISDSNDSMLMLRALNSYRFNSKIDVQDAGTAMRFLTAFLACQGEGEWELFGTNRMHERPIGTLVDALQSLGAEIEYLGEEGFPPLLIRGRSLHGGEIAVEATESSQFISALMMIAPQLEGGLSIKFKGASVSAPYIYLTANLMRQLSFKVFVLGDEVRLEQQNPQLKVQSFRVEPDWSAASYWFSALALAEKGELYLPGFKEFSMQGDSVLAQFYAPLGIEQFYIGSGIRLRKAEPTPAPKEINLLDNPDLAQSLAPAYAAAGKVIRLKGLQTLRIKETDRIMALEKELFKFQVETIAETDFLEVRSGFIAGLQEVDTYKDHRMAMAFLPLALLHPVVIKDVEVVKKSYPQFWDHCQELGFRIEEL